MPCSAHPWLQLSLDPSARRENIHRGMFLGDFLFFFHAGGWQAVMELKKFREERKLDFLPPLP